MKMNYFVQLYGPYHHSDVVLRKHHHVLDGKRDHVPRRNLNRLASMVGLSLSCSFSSGLLCFNAGFASVVEPFNYTQGPTACWCASCHGSDIRFVDIKVL